ANVTVRAQDRAGGGADDDRQQLLAGQRCQREISHAVGQRNLDAALLGFFDWLTEVVRKVDQMIACQRLYLRPRIRDANDKHRRAVDTEKDARRRFVGPMGEVVSLALCRSLQPLQDLADTPIVGDHWTRWLGWSLPQRSLQHLQQPI